MPVATTSPALVEGECWLDLGPIGGHGDGEIGGLRQVDQAEIHGHAPAVVRSRGQTEVGRRALGNRIRLGNRHRLVIAGHAGQPMHVQGPAVTDGARAGCPGRRQGHPVIETGLIIRQIVKAAACRARGAKYIQCGVLFRGIGLIQIVVIPNLPPGVAGAATAWIDMAHRAVLATEQPGGGGSAVSLAEREHIVLESIHRHRGAAPAQKQHDQKPAP